MVKNFSGQVKISDVKNEFDNLVTRINAMVDAYNESGTIKDHDYSVAGDTLAPSGYTLTIGGLKQVLENYDGLIFGCKPFKVSSSSVKVTDGILFTQDGCYKINGQTLSGQGDTIYYDPVKNQLTYGSTVTTKWVTWTQPTITSNTSWGQMSGSTNSSNAYLAVNTPSSSISKGFGWGKTFGNTSGGAYRGTPTITFTWKFKQKLKLSKVAFYTYWLNFAGAKRLNVYVTDLNGTSLGTITKGTSPDDGATYPWTCTVNNKIVDGIKIKLSITTYNNLFSGILALGTLRLTGQYAKQVTTTGDTEDLYKVCDLNWNRGSNAIEDIPQIQSEDFSSKYKITTVSREFSDAQFESLQNNPQSLNTSSSGKFVWGNEKIAYRGDAQAEALLLNKRVAYNHEVNGNSSTTYWTAPSFLYVPKGIDNPYSYNNGSAQVVFSPKIQK